MTNDALPEGVTESQMDAYSLGLLRGSQERKKLKAENERLADAVREAWEIITEAWTLLMHDLPKAQPNYTPNRSAMRTWLDQNAAKETFTRTLPSKPLTAHPPIERFGESDEAGESE